GTSTLTGAAVGTTTAALTVSGNQHPVVELELEIVVVVKGIVLVMLMVYLEVVVVVE
nr:hypothetical protein [Tanacetum cinerariifolium]